jgi:AraC-like DNA-binding protein
MTEIPLIRVRYAAAFAQSLTKLGSSPTRLLEQSGLNDDMLRIRDGFMPVSQLQNFTASAAEQTGLWHLGLRAGIAPREQHSEFSARAMLAPTLLQSIRSIISAAKSEDGSANFHIVQGRNHAWLCCGKAEGSPEAVRQIEIYRYGALLQVLRYAAGPEWLPPKLKLQSSDDGRLRDIAMIRDVNVEFDSAMLSIAIPSLLLGHALENTADSKVQVASSPLVPPPGPDHSFEHTVKEVVRAHMLAHRSEISDVARSLGTSVRTLQRQLAKRGASFSNLLEQTRMETARTMLNEFDTSLSDIAAELGYRQSTHFSRAFRRVCGVSPSLYRSREHHRDQAI